MSARGVNERLKHFKIIVGRFSFFKKKRAGVVFLKRNYQRRFIFINCKGLIRNVKTIETNFFILPLN